MSAPNEPTALAQAYARREGAATRAHGFLQEDVLHRLQERQRVMVRLMRDLGWTDLSQRKVLEVGCGAGGNLLELLRMGFMPRNLKGIELLQERYDHACEVLPSALRLLQGDALGDEAQRVIPPASQDMVLAFTVFSSILDAGAQVQLADALWRWVRPGGGVLWYDFTVDNPRNPDVRGISVDRVRQLFPVAQLHVRPLTVAPPLARWAARRHPAWLSLLAQVPTVRTHVLVWAQKPLEPPPPSVARA